MIGRVTVDPRAALGALTDAQEKQVPFAVALALNWSANIAQGAEQNRLKARFKMNRAAFTLQGIKIENADRATKTTWRVVIQVQANRDYLNKFEKGGYKLPTHGRWIWMPNPAVFKGKIIPENMRPKALQFHQVGMNLVGLQRAFIVKGKGGPLVLQRVDKGIDKRGRKALGKMTLDNVHVGIGPKEKGKYSLQRTEGVRMLYQLVRRVIVPVKLEFVDTITGTVLDVFPNRLEAALAYAMRTGR